MPSTHSEPLLKLSQISLSYHGKQALENVDLTINTGEIITIIGPNGAGKSSLAKVALGLIKPNSGTRWTQKNLTIGYMPQKLHIDPSMPLTVERFLWLAGKSTKRQRRDALQRVSATHLEKRQIGRLSGGETQRVLLARALLRVPQLLVLDEPAQGVDLGGQTELYNLLTQVQQQTGCAILLVSHDLHWVLASTNRVVCMQSHICCEGTPEVVRNSDTFTQLFGDLTQAPLALYHHHHDHVHTLDGHQHHKDQPNV